MPSMDGEMSSMDGEMPSMDGEVSFMDGEVSSMDGEISSMDGETSSIDDSTICGCYPWMDGWRRQMTDMDGAKVKRSRQKIFSGINLFRGGFCSSVLRKMHFAISWLIFFKIQF